MIAREIDKAGIPVAHITAMSMMSKQFGVNRVVNGVKVPHPCGDPNLPAKADKDLRREIIKCAISAIQTEVSSPQIFIPDVTYSRG